MSLTCLVATVALMSGTNQKSGPEVYVQKIPGSLVELRMIKVLDGTMTLNGKKTEIKDLWVAETEVTWDLFDIWAFRLDQSPEEQAAGVDAKSRPSKPYGAPDRGFGHDGYPALGMTRFAAEEFCTWLSKKTGVQYRLPTDSEWVYAAIARNAILPKNRGDVAWYWDNADDKTHPVKKLAPNTFGLYDMLGNVAEWVTRPGDSTPTLSGGHFLTRQKEIKFQNFEAQTPAWNANDPQNPKSKWWLANAPFAGFRVVFVGTRPL